MDDNVMRILQLLQDGKISPQEAETLIAALRGEAAPPPAAEEKEDRGDRGFLGSFEKLKPPKIDLDDLGDRISKAVSRVQPEKIVKRVQSQLRSATRSGAHWGATVATKVRTWTEGEDSRPTNGGGLPEHTESHDQDFYLQEGAFLTVENPLGDVKVVGVAESTAAVSIRKVAWGPRPEDAKAAADRIIVETHGTDTRLDVKVSAPDYYREGTVDLEVRLPRSASVRISTHFGTIDASGMDGRTEAVSTTGAISLHDLGGDARGESASGDMSIARVEGSATVATQSGDIAAEDVRKGLTANTASGDVRAQNIEGGRVECKSVSGDTSAEGIGRLAPLDITVESISGDASLKDANGSIALKAVSGDVQASDVTSNRLQAQTVSGDVSLALREPFAGTLNANTVSGDVSILLPRGSNVRVSLTTSSGELHCDHVAEVSSSTETLWSGQIGTGAGTLNVQTISGDTQIRVAE